MRDIQNYNMEHVDTLAPDTIKESVMCRHSQLSLLLADIQGRISNAPEGSLRTARKHISKSITIILQLNLHKKIMI